MSLFSIGLGCVCMLHFWYILLKSLKTNKWISVEGEIIKLDINNIQFNIDKSDPAYKAIIVYKYIVGGKEYISNRIFIGDYLRRSSLLPINELLAKYGSKKSVIVYYNHIKPSSSVLEPGINTIIYREFILGVLFILLPFLWSFFK